MIRVLPILICCCLAMCNRSFANNYATPGTGVHWNLADLVAHAGGDVTYSSELYHVNDTVFISLNDTLYINSDATVNFVVGSYLDVNGTLLVNPPTGVLFSAENKVAGYLGMRIDSSNSTVLRKLTFEYAVSLRLSDCNIRIDSCVFQYNNNNMSTSFGNGAIAVFRASPVITNSKFLSNQRAAIQGGANISNAPKISNCLFMGNNSTTSSLPQINLGATGTDTARIINNQFLRASIYSGAIAFLPIGTANVVITGNLIKNNRYGISLQGGADINSLISYNIIDSNNTQGDPLLGGSGINFAGGTATSHQNSIVTGNLIRWNLWGITISPTSTQPLGGAKPNLGNLTNTDTTDDGKNQFIDNHNNSSTPNIDFYNNNVDPIFAQNNYWGTNTLSGVEDRIYHQADNAALGLVNYSSPILILPVDLVNLAAIADKNNITLTWQTLSESNSDHFEIEKSDDGISFIATGTVIAKGMSNTLQSYNFTDTRIVRANQLVFYRLKMIDKDGRFKYSAVVSAKINKAMASIQLYPSLVSSSQIVYADISSSKSQKLNISFYDNSGRLLSTITKQLAAGDNHLPIRTAGLPKGQVFIRFGGETIKEIVPVIVE